MGNATSIHSWREQSRPRLAILALAAVILAAPGATLAADLPKDVLYIESNNAQAGFNAIIAYKRAADGSVTPLAGSPFPTGGRGFFDPSYAVGPFDSDQNLAVDAERGVLYAPNSGSGTIAALRIKQNGSLFPIAGSPFAYRPSDPFGIPPAPVALGLKGNKLVVVDNAATNNPAGKQPSYTLLSIVGPEGRLKMRPGTTVALPDGSYPSQALTETHSPFFFTTEFFGGTIRSFMRGPTGLPVQLEVETLPLERGETRQPLPLGLYAHPTKAILYVGFVTANRLGVYRWNNIGALQFIRTVPNSGQAICWLRTTADGRRLYTTNTADRSMSVYDLSKPESPVETSRVVLAGEGGLFQFSLSPDERFIYAIEQEDKPSAMGKSNLLHILKIDPADGSLTELASSPVKLPVEAGERPQGIVVF